MKIRINLRQKILRILEEKGYIIINSSRDAKELLMKEFPENNYLNKNQETSYIVIRKTFYSFDIGYKKYRFHYYEDILNEVEIKNSRIYSIEHLK